MAWSLNNSMVFVLLACSAVLTASYVFLWSHWALGDESNDRSLHQGKTLTAGGVFVVLPWLLYATWESLQLWPQIWPLYGVWLMLLVGLADDVWHWNAKPKIFAQFAATLILLYYFGYLTPSLWFVFLLFAVLWWLNLFNFMDGANGMAGLHAVVVLAFYLLLIGVSGSDITLMILALLGALMVFLIFNMVLGRLFMGDAGSLPLAFVQAWLAVYALSHSLLSVPLLIMLHASFVADASYTLVVRTKNRERLSEAHNTHFYQRWVKKGASHTQVSVSYAMVTAACAVVAYTLSGSSPVLQWSVTLACYFLMALFFIKTIHLSR